MEAGSNFVKLHFKWVVCALKSCHRFKGYLSVWRISMGKQW